MFLAKENTTKRLFQGTPTFSSTFSFDIIFLCPGLQYSNYVYCWVIGLRFLVNSTVLPVDRKLDFENKSPLSESQFLCIEVTKIGEEWLDLLILQW